MKIYVVNLIKRKKSYAIISTLLLLVITISAAISIFTKIYGSDFMFTYSNFCIYTIFSSQKYKIFHKFLYNYEFI